MDDPRAWFVICVPPEKPDGPGEVFGPFDTRQRADDDAAVGVETECPNRHMVVYGPGTDRVRLSSSRPAIDAYSWFHERPEQIPASCRHLFRSLFAGSLDA